MELLTDRYSDKIGGVLNCYDRIVLKGTLPMVCFTEDMTSYLYKNKIPIFYYTKFFAVDGVSPSTS